MYGIIAAILLASPPPVELLLPALTGACSVEEIDVQTVENLEKLLSHPLKLNSTSGPELLESSLFSPFQLASLKEYMAEHGPVLSFSELAAVDGFTEDGVRLLAPFLDLDASLWRAPAVRRFSLDLQGRAAAKDVRNAVGERLKLSLGQDFELALAGRSSYSDQKDFPPPAGSAYFCYRPGGSFAGMPGKKLRLATIVIGSYQARFGQGLGFWSGTSIGSADAPAAFYKRAHGVSPSWSWSGSSLHGAAVQAEAGRWNFSAFAWSEGESGLVRNVAFNVSRFGRTVQWGCTAGPAKMSADIRACLSGHELFAELAADYLSAAPAFLAGGVLSFAGGRLAFQGHYYAPAFNPGLSAALKDFGSNSDEAGASVSFERKAFVFTAQRAVKLSSRAGSLSFRETQLRLLSRCSFKIAGADVLLQARHRLRSYGDRHRTEVRLRLGSGSGAFPLNLRFDLVSCRGTGILAYAEQGMNWGPMNLWLRCTGFCAANWSDRIYCYERDAPGSFLVPAYYGRGWVSSFFSNWKKRVGHFRLDMCLRASLTVWPGTDKKSVFELRGYLALGILSF